MSRLMNELRKKKIPKSTKSRYPTISDPAQSNVVIRDPQRSLKRELRKGLKYNI